MVKIPFQTRKWSFDSIQLLISFSVRLFYIVYKDTLPALLVGYKTPWISYNHDICQSNVSIVVVSDLNDTQYLQYYRIAFLGFVS